MSQNGKLMPNLDQESTKVLNLTVLRRIDPFVEEILTTAAHVTFYEFNIEQSRWSRKDVEGSLFVVKRNTQPRFQFIVMNRRNTDNLVENLLGDFEYEVQGPYLLYKNASQEVNGIWFYNARECEEVGNLFNRILNAYSKVPPKPKAASKSEFEELEAVPTSAVIEGPLEPLSSSASAIADVPDDSFVNYFSAAMNVGTASNAAISSPSHQALLVPSSSHPASVPTGPSLIPTPTIPSPPLPTSSAPLVPAILDASDSSTGRVTNLVKPSTFFGPSSSSAFMVPTISLSTPTAPPLQPPVNLQRPYGAPILQPLPPPIPPPSLTPSYGPVITREKVRDALMRLSQNNNFIDLVYRELLNAHYS
ncbi:mRNA-decapping enzyme-like protein [Nymphaea colorata]|nr:mRNA-decapping enzyme-like protein [Nymphaea colorata]